MIIETDRLIIRDVALPDGEAFIHMASDGSLNDVGFDKDCSSWMDDWIIEVQKLAREDNSRKYYLVVISKCCAMAQCKIWRRSYGFYWNQ